MRACARSLHNIFPLGSSNYNNNRSMHSHPARRRAAKPNNSISGAQWTGMTTALGARWEARTHARACINVSVEWCNSGLISSILVWNTASPPPSLGPLQNPLSRAGVIIAIWNGVHYIIALSPSSLLLYLSHVLSRTLFPLVVQSRHHRIVVVIIVVVVVATAAAIDHMAHNP